MAESLLPWMRDYFTDLLQKHGSDISNVPVYTKKKKVQITKVSKHWRMSPDHH